MSNSIVVDVFCRLVLQKNSLLYRTFARRFLFYSDVETRGKVRHFEEKKAHGQTHRRRTTSGITRLEIVVIVRRTLRTSSTTIRTARRRRSPVAEQNFSSSDRRRTSTDDRQTFASTRTNSNDSFRRLADRAERVDDGNRLETAGNSSENDSMEIVRSVRSATGRGGLLYHQLKLNE